MNETLNTSYGVWTAFIILLILIFLFLIIAYVYFGPSVIQLKCLSYGFNQQPCPQYCLDLSPTGCLL